MAATHHQPRHDIANALQPKPPSDIRPIFRQGQAEPVRGGPGRHQIVKPDSDDPDNVVHV
jgi:hypothetical protein